MEFDRDRLLQYLALYAPSVGTDQIFVYDSILSTNTTLWAMLDQSIRARSAWEGTVAIALEQRAGRGQWGRQWQSSRGGLFLSWAVQPDLSAPLASQLTLCSAWGITQTLRQHHMPVQLKWPNDLVLAGQKLGGILTETRVQQGRITHAVVGVGLNWSNPVPATGINLETWQHNYPQDFKLESLEHLAALTVQGLWCGYRFWQVHGIDPLLKRYFALLSDRDRPRLIENQPGQIIGITATGDLRVRYLTTPPVEKCIKPGEISLGYTESPEFKL